MRQNAKCKPFDKPDLLLITVSSFSNMQRQVSAICSADPVGKCFINRVVLLRVEGQGQE